MGKTGTPLPAAQAIGYHAFEAMQGALPLPQAALVYRLSCAADRLHTNPTLAGVAVCSRPLLHGIVTMDMALHAMLRTERLWRGAAAISLARSGHADHND